jgi:hypothetical protein
MKLEEHTIPLFNKIVEGLKKMPEHKEKPLKELMNELQERTIYLGCLLVELYGRIDEMKKECEKP